LQKLGKISLKFQHHKYEKNIGLHLHLGKCLKRWLDRLDFVLLPKRKMKNEKNEKISDFWGVSIMLEIRKITIIILDL
jgi:hypothetical protein